MGPSVHGSALTLHCAEGHAHKNKGYAVPAKARGTLTLQNERPDQEMLVAGYFDC